MIGSWLGQWESLADGLHLRIVLTLLHFLWQGAAIGAVAVVAARMLRTSSASSRYALHAVALASLPMSVVVTFATVEVPSDWKTVEVVRVVDEADFASGTTAPVASTRPSTGNSIIDSQDLRPNDHNHDVPSLHTAAEQGSLAGDGPLHIDRSLEEASHAQPLIARMAPGVATTYLAGACLFLLRLVTATWGGHRLRRASKPIDDPSLLQLFVDQSRRVGLRWVPIVAYCERISVPMVIGVLRPVVLLPASIITGLGPEQFAAIISHELAHIRRCDLLLNLIQRLVESLLFFHPAVWYISRRMSAEREICCDDLVVSSGYKPLDYAGALLRMAELCLPTQHSEAAAIAASGESPSQLEARIRRLISTKRDSRLRITRTGALMIALLMIPIAFTPVVVSNWAEARPPEPIKEQRESEPSEPPSGAARPDAPADLAGPALAADTGKDDPWPPQDPAKFLTRLQRRDAEFSNRSLEIERRWVERIDPVSVVAEEQRIRSIKKLPKIATPPDDWIAAPYDQPHRVPYRMTTGWNVQTIDNADDLETMKHPRYGKAVRVQRWPDGPRMMARNAVMMNGFFQITSLQERRRQSFEWSSGYGFARRIVSIDSLRFLNERGLQKDRIVIKGKSRVFPHGPSPHKDDSRFEIELDRDLIVRRAVITLALKTAGYERLNPDADRIQRFLVKTSGTLRPKNAPAVAAQGHYRVIYKNPGSPETIHHDETITFVGITKKRTAKQLAGGIDHDRKPYTGKMSASDDALKDTRRSKATKTTIEQAPPGVKWGKPAHGLRAAIVIRTSPDELIASDWPKLYLAVQNVSNAPIRLNDTVPAEKLRKLYLKLDGKIVMGLVDKKPTVGDLVIPPRKVAFVFMFSPSSRGPDGRTMGSLLAEGTLKEVRQSMVAQIQIEQAPAGAWTGKLVTGEASGAVAAGKQESDQEQYDQPDQGRSDPIGKRDNQ